MSESPRKKFMFYDTAKRQADFRIRLQYDGMNQSQFFRAMITGYLNKDMNLLSYLDDYKQKNKVQGTEKRLASGRLLKKGSETENQFALNEGEIQDIFDLLEKEHPDL
jgi:hypothetical protein